MFKNMLKTLRKENNLTQQELAEKTKVNQQQISKWESGFLEPNINQLKSVADVLQVSIDYLVGRSDEAGIIRSNANLAPDEAELLDLYRQMSFQDKNQLRGFAKALIY